MMGGMWRLMSSLVIAGLWSGSLAAESCPPPPDHAVEFARLVEEVRDAENERAARRITNEMWGTLGRCAPMSGRNPCSSGA